MPDYKNRLAHIPDSASRSYTAMTAALDNAVGRVMDTLTTEGIDQQTLVFLTFIFDAITVVVESPEM